MNRYKVSVIIPVFNAGTYLRDCLDSLINQTLNDMEFILVLDCPTDGSESVCREYETERAAYNALNNLQNQKEFADGWVLKLSPISSH